MDPVTLTAMVVTALLGGIASGAGEAVYVDVRQKFQQKGRENLLERVREEPVIIQTELIEQMRDDQEFQNRLERSLEASGITRQKVISGIRAKTGVKVEDVTVEIIGSIIADQIVITDIQTEGSIEIKGVSVTSQKKIPLQLSQASQNIEILSGLVAGGDITITVGDITVSTKRPESPPKLRRDATRNFVGRQQELEALDRQLNQAGTLAISAIKGMGGIGKTELTLQFATSARKNNKYPGGICWIDVRGKNIVDEVLDFANKCLDFIPPDNQTPQNKVEICWNLWSECFKQDKLLILDDVSDYMQIDGYLPPYDPSLKVIITTRLRLEALNIESLVLEVLSDAEALNLLRTYIESQRIEDELEYAQKLCEWVGNLPLGLILIGRYLKEFKEDSLKELLGQLQKQGLDQKAMHETEVFIGGGTTANLWRGERRIYDSVFAVFNLNWRYLQQSGKQLGAILSLFNAPAYTWSLVEKAAKPLGQHRGTAKIDLKDLHLIHEDESSIHPLIQEFFRKKLVEDKDFLSIQDVLFDNFIFQQYVYDTGYLENSLEQVEKIREVLPPDNIKGHILLSKMIGHSYYADRSQGMKKAIENMFRAQEYVEKNQHLASQDESKAWIWYRLFALDHVQNLVVTEGSIDIDGRRITAEELEHIIYSILPDELKQLDSAPTIDACPYILRAAHYWGHRGNQCSFLFYRDIKKLSLEKLDKLYSQGINYYARAAIFRLVNFRLSCSEEYQEHLNEALREASYIPEWLSNWNSNYFQSHDISFERFTSASQAIGDTAHQFRGIADIKLWGYIYKARHGRINQNFLKEAEQVIQTTRVLWGISKELTRKTREKVIKYYLWIANLETKFELVRDHYLNQPLISWEEAERRVIIDLDELESQYRLGYPWARQISVKQLREFYIALESIYKP
jgi:NB-ARC domain